MFKKFIAISFVLLMLLLTFIPASAAGSPTVTVSSATAKPGETVVLSVKMKNNPGINTFSFGINYDSKKLTLQEVKASSKLGGQFMYGKKAVWLNSKDTTYNGEIMTLKFVVAKSASGKAKVKLTYSPGDISNYNEQDVNFSIEPGTITIASNGSSSGSSGSNQNTPEVKQSWIQKLIVFLKRILSFFGKK